MSQDGAKEAYVSLINDVLEMDYLRSQKTSSALGVFRLKQYTGSTLQDKCQLLVQRKDLYPVQEVTTVHDFAENVLESAKEVKTAASPTNKGAPQAPTTSSDALK
jgi:hypothetical protein